MSEVTRQSTWTWEAYLDGEARQPIRHEPVDGEIRPMGGDTAEHDVIGNNLRAALHTQMRRRPCRVHGPDLKVRAGAHVLGLDPRNGRYPDALVDCGRALSGSFGRARLSFTSAWNPRTNIVATNTLDAVRQRLAAEEPELRRRGVRHLAVFGSVARGDDRPDSDVDVAVEIEADRSFSLIRMEETRLFLEDALRRRVDLGEVDSFRPQVRAAFERERVAIF